MTDDLAEAFKRYDVVPQSPPALRLPQETKAAWIAPSGWVVFFVWAFFINMPTLFLAQAVFGEIGFGVPLSLVAGFALYWFRGVAKGRAAWRQLREQEQLEWRRAGERLVETSRVEAHDTAVGLRLSLVTSSHVRESLFASLARASRALDQALVEHRERAYATFWHAIETAAAALADYREGVEQMGRTARDYYAKLEGRSHTFPPFPYLTSDLPPADDIVNRFKQVMRAGQTDFEFANIWEHRKTRETIKTGFGSLEAAVREVGASIVTAVDGVHAALDSGFERLVDAHNASTASITAAIAGAAEQIGADLENERRQVCAILDSQDQKLDRIQWRRKPSGASY